MTENQIAGTILMILGGLQALWPQLLLRFQIWVQKVIMGADYVPSTRTVKITRFLGVFVLALGLLIITEVIK